MNRLQVLSGSQPWGGLETTDGRYYVSVQGSGSFIEQTVSGLTPGAAYNVDFIAAERPGALSKPWEASDLSFCHSVKVLFAPLDASRRDGPYSHKLFQSCPQKRTTESQPGDGTTTKSHQLIMWMARLRRRRVAARGGGRGGGNG